MCRSLVSGAPWRSRTALSPYALLSGHIGGGSRYADSSRRSGMGERPVAAPIGGGLGRWPPRGYEILRGGIPGRRSLEERMANRGVGPRRTRRTHMVARPTSSSEGQSDSHLVAGLGRPPTGSQRPEVPGPGISGIVLERRIEAPQSAAGVVDRAAVPFDRGWTSGTEPSVPSRHRVPSTRQSLLQLAEGLGAVLHLGREGPNLDRYAAR